jgi:2-C-methyl-D-erythritol 4-phosphate cytidylyltransferase
VTARKPARGYAALVLAGRRHGEDPLAEAAGAPHRALLDIHGTPMLERVLRTLVETPCIGHIVVSIDQPRLLDRFPGIVALRDRGESQIVVVQATDSPSRSVLAILDDGPPDQPVLVTTADHALLDVPLVEHFLAEAESRGGDVAVGLVSSAVLLARFPDARRTYLRFADERYSGANLFAFQTPRARRAVEFWRHAESFRKRPWRLVASFGLRALWLFLTRRLTLEEAFAEVSRTLGARAVPIVLPQAEAAVDVDKLEDLELVRRILASELQPEESPPDEPMPDETSQPAARGPRDEAAGTKEPRDDAEAQSGTSPSGTKPPLAAS